MDVVTDVLRRAAASARAAFAPIRADRRGDDEAPCLVSKQRVDKDGILLRSDVVRRHERSSDDNPTCPTHVATHDRCDQLAVVCMTYPWQRLLPACTLPECRSPLQSAPAGDACAC